MHAQRAKSLQFSVGSTQEAKGNKQYSEVCSSQFSTSNMQYAIAHFKYQ